MGAETDAYYERLRLAREAVDWDAPVVEGVCRTCRQPLDQPGPMLEYGGGGRKCTHPGDTMPIEAVPDPPADNVTAMAELTLSTLLSVAHASLRHAGAADLEHLDTVTLADAYDDLKGPEGIIAAFSTVARDIENEIVTRIPLVESGRSKGKPQKWTAIPRWRIERNQTGGWTVDSKAVLTRVLEDLGDALTPETAADLIVNLISGIDTSWKTTELEEALGGPHYEPIVEDGEPVLITRGENKGQPKTEKVHRLVHEQLGERTEGRYTIRLHRGEQ